MKENELEKREGEKERDSMPPVEGLVDVIKVTEEASTSMQD